jgi:hypothetical protein
MLPKTTPHARSRPRDVAALVRAGTETGSHADVKTGGIAGILFRR